MFLAAVFCHHAVRLHAKAYFTVLTSAVGHVSHAQPIAPHMLSAMVSNKTGVSSFPDCICCSHRPRAISCQSLILFSFQPEKRPHRPCLPSFHSIQDRSAPGPAFTPEAEYTVDMFQHYHAFHSPWYVFASVDKSVQTYFKTSGNIFQPSCTCPSPSVSCLTASSLPPVGQTSVGGALLKGLF